MGPIEATQSVLTNFAEFSGRASRSEYWWFVAVWTVAYFAVLGLQYKRAKWPEYAFIAATLVPVMSVSFRRLQDIGHSGWWSVFEVVVICGISSVLYRSMPTDADNDMVFTSNRTFTISGVLFVLVAIGIFLHFSLPSETGPNKYGPNPHEVTS